MPTKVFILYSDTPDRRAALKGEDEAGVQQYLLYGLRQLRASGFCVDHNLVGSGPSTSLAARLIWRMNGVLHRWGGYGGDFPTILRCRREINASDLILSTVDSVGIALVLLKRVGLIRPPIIYTSIGLPERMPRIRRERVRLFYRRAFGRVAGFATYGFEEAEWIREWLAPLPDPPPVTFVPFGVDAEYFRPQTESPVDVDIMSIGRDSQRDFRQLTAFADRRRDVTVRLITSRAHAAECGDVPPNVNLICDVPFAEIRAQMARARVVALPVRANTYSGATTALLQCMAMGKPVVVSRVGAIREGYGLQDGVNCRLVPPGDSGAFGDALAGLLANPRDADELGRRARDHVVENLSWDRYEGHMRGLIEDTLEGVSAL